MVIDSSKVRGLQVAPRKRSKKALKEVRASIEAELRDLATSEMLPEYFDERARRLKTLMELAKEYESTKQAGKISSGKKLEVGTYFASILMIIKSEEVRSIITKAISFIPKLKL